MKNGKDCIRVFIDAQYCGTQLKSTDISEIFRLKGTCPEINVDESNASTRTPSRSSRTWCTCGPCTNRVKRRPIGRHIWGIRNPCSICSKNRQKLQPKTRVKPNQKVKYQQPHWHRVTYILSTKLLQHVPLWEETTIAHVRYRTVRPDRPASKSNTRIASWNKYRICTYIYV